MEIALYNTDKKELIGVFKSLALASRYVFNEVSTWNNSRIWNAHAYKTRLYKNTKFKFPIAVRLANEKQALMLGNKQVIILNNYPAMPSYRIQGMKTCKNLK